MEATRGGKGSLGVPVFAYQGSGDYWLLRAAIANGWLDERMVIMQSLLCLRRRGADMILTYFGKQAAAWLAEGPA